ncbi:MAG: AhpC/TSA family protein [Flavobacteriaceae bacterium]|nr:AhpC/TSA family protein [Bacteroidia bacterium]NNF74703.1 AhpC/TSA family protein [Flavobacteriaceae bacterium]NNK73487.1 AhpC/TSA family protein [Flavobacteriaceae bacterium]
MKKYILIVFTLTILFSCAEKEPERVLPPNTYEVNLSAKGVFNGIRTYLNTVDNRGQQVPVDTAMVANEWATFSGKVIEPQFIVLTVDGSRGNTQFILEPGITNIEVYKDSLHTSIIEGSPINDSHTNYKKEYIKKLQEAQNARGVLNALRRTNDTTGYSALYDNVMETDEAVKQFNNNYIASHTDEEFSLLLLESLIISGKNQNLQKFKSNYEAVKKHIKKRPSYKAKQQRIESFIGQLEAVANVDIGKIAPNFSGPKPDGEILSLDDIKGKATLIDFWASWCGPCRRENPNVVRVYEKYHDKGLEIISVSLDRPNQRDRWLQAIAQDKMNWHHVSNLKYWNDPIAALYNVTSIPATFLLDENGRIVAKKLRGQALEDQVAKMLN